MTRVSILRSLDKASGARRTYLGDRWEKLYSKFDFAWDGPDRIDLLDSVLAGTGGWVGRSPSAGTAAILSASGPRPDRVQV